MPGMGGVEGGGSSVSNTSRGSRHRKAVYSSRTTHRGRLENRIGIVPYLFGYKTGVSPL